MNSSNLAEPTAIRRGHKARVACFFFDRIEAAELLEKNIDWIYEWSSRPDQAPPKDWKFKHPQRVNKKKSYSIRTTKVGKVGLFSKEVLYTLFITNILSVLVGAGLGVWLSRRGSITSSVTIE